MHKKLQILVQAEPTVEKLCKGFQLLLLTGTCTSLLNVLAIEIELFISLDEEDEDIGCLYYCEAGQHQKLPDQRVPMHHIKDVLIGKKTTELRSSFAGTFSSNRCVGLISRKCTLSLVAKDGRQRSELLAAIKFIFVMATKGLLPVDPDPMLTQRMQTMDIKFASPNANAVLAASEETMDENEALANLTSGVTVLLADAEGNHQEHLLRYQELSLCFVSILHKNSFSIAASALIDAYSTSKTLTLVTNTDDFVLSVLHQDELFTLIAAIKKIRQTCSEQSLRTPPLFISPIRKATPYKVLTEGAEFLSFYRKHIETSLFGNELCVASKVVKLSWETDDAHQLGYLVQNDVQTGVVRREKLWFQEILSGKVSDELTSNAASTAIAECCWSLVGNNFSLHLQAATEHQRNAWIDSIRLLYTAAKKAEFLLTDSRSTVYNTTISSSDEQLSRTLPMLVQGVRARLLNYATKNIRVWLQPTSNQTGRLHLSAYDYVDLHEIVSLQLEEYKLHLLKDDRERYTLLFNSLVEARSFASSLQVAMMNPHDMIAFAYHTCFVSTTNEPNFELVNTRLGICQAQSFTIRDDDTIAVKLPWTTVFAPAQQIIRFTGVWTLKQGLGFIASQANLPALKNKTQVEVWLRRANGQLHRAIVKAEECIHLPFLPASLLDKCKTQLANLTSAIVTDSVDTFNSISSLATKSDPLSTPSTYLNAHPAIVAPLCQSSFKLSTLEPDELPPPVLETVVFPRKRHQQDQNISPSVMLSSLPLLHFGQFFYLWRGTIATTNRTSVMIVLDAATNHLFWHSIEEPRRMIDDQSMQVLKIDCILKGKECQLLSAPQLESVDASLCCSLHSGNKNWCIQATAEHSRDEFVFEVKRWIAYSECLGRFTQQTSSLATTIIASSGKSTSVPMNVTPATVKATSDEQRPVGSPYVPSGFHQRSQTDTERTTLAGIHHRTPSTPQAPAFVRQSNPESSIAVDLFFLGMPFTRWHEDGTHEEIQVYYHQDSSRLGSLYWCSAKRAKERPLNSAERIPLVSLSELTIGKVATIKAQKLEPHLCVTLATKKISLHLSAQDQILRDGFVTRIKSLIRLSGKKIVEDGVEDSTSSSFRAFPL